MEIKMSNNKRFLRLKEVIERTGRSRSSIYLDMDLGRFPMSVKLGARSIGWLESDIDAWIQERIQQSRTAE